LIDDWIAGESRRAIRPGKPGRPRENGQQRNSLLQSGKLAGGLPRAGAKGIQPQDSTTLPVDRLDDRKITPDAVTIAV
jgi:hypothetical protein